MTFDGDVLPDPQRHHLRPAARRRCRSTSPRPGRQLRRLAGRVADGLICTSGKGMELYRGHAASRRRRGRARRRTGAGGPRADDRDEGVVRQRPRRALARTHGTGLRSRFPPRRRPASRTPSRWSGSPTRCRPSGRRAAGSSRRDPDEHVERIRPYLDLGFTHLVFHAPGRRSASVSRAVRARGAPATPRGCASPPRILSAGSERFSPGLSGRSGRR